ncbi:unnamed protein product [Discosporangium mesarthrocarpum]
MELLVVLPLYAQGLCSPAIPASGMPSQLEVGVVPSESRPSNKPGERTRARAGAGGREGTLGLGGGRNQTAGSTACSPSSSAPRGLAMTGRLLCLLATGCGGGEQTPAGAQGCVCVDSGDDDNGGLLCEGGKGVGVEEEGLFGICRREDGTRGRNSCSLSVIALGRGRPCRSSRFRGPPSVMGTAAAATASSGGGGVCKRDKSGLRCLGDCGGFVAGLAPDGSVRARPLLGGSMWALIPPPVAQSTIGGTDGGGRKGARAVAMHCSPAGISAVAVAKGTGPALVVELYSFPQAGFLNASQGRAAPQGGELAGKWK